MSVKEQLQNDMKAALRRGDKKRLSVIRMALASIQQREVDTRSELDDPATLNVLEKMLKQRRESVTQYEAGGRDDLVQQEQFEISVLKGYMPEPLSAVEIDELIATAIVATGAGSMRDMGKVMAEVKAKAEGRADMRQVSAKVKDRLNA